MDTEIICNICWEEKQDSICTLSCCPCNSYHKQCIEKWFDLSSTCPFCRRINELYRTRSSISIEVVSNEAHTMLSIQQRNNSEHKLDVFTKIILCFVMIILIMIMFMIFIVNVF